MPYNKTYPYQCASVGLVLMAPADKREIQVQSYGSNSRICATCGRWDGPRQADNFGGLVQVNPNSKGTCQGGAFNRQQMNTGATCQQYVKWQVLR